MSIDRKAILIGAPSVKPTLPGVEVDVEDIKNHLLSNRGGAWRESEIIILLDPSPAEVNRELIGAKMKDYVFISCSGHGEHQVGEGLDETVMYLSERESIPISSINPKNKRHLVIVDVCRNLVKIEQPSLFRDSISATERFSESYINYRKEFDDAVMSKSEGRIVAYSCDLNQSAGDDGSGGVFTQALLSTPNGFSPAQGHQFAVLGIDKAFDAAKKITYTKNAPQSPVFNAGRRRDFFPFAIV